MALLINRQREPVAGGSFISLNVTPAMAAGVTSKLWEVSDMVALLEEREAAIAPTKRGSYKKKVSN